MGHSPRTSTELPTDKLPPNTEHVELEGAKSRAINSHVGPELAAVLPQHGRPWFLVPSLLRLNIYVGIVMLSATTMGFDGSMMNGLQGLDSWMGYFGNPSGAKLGIMNAVLFLGIVCEHRPRVLLSLLTVSLISTKQLINVPVAWLPDAIGRRYTMLIGSIILITGAAIQGSAKSVSTFIVARLIIGLGNQFASLPAPVLISEIAYPPHRGRATGLFQTNFYLGSIASSWITFGTFHLASTWSWRIPSILQGFFPLIQLLGLWFVPESPRWLASKDRIEEARAVLGKYHAAGDPSHPLVDFEMQEITSHIQAEQELAGMGWGSLIKTKGDRKRLAVSMFVVVVSQFSGNSVITYYLSLVLDTIGVTDSFTKTLINGILQIFNFFAAIGGSLAVDRLGRRTLWLWSCVGMLCTYIIFTACSAAFVDSRNHATAVVVIVFIFLYFFHYDIAVTPLTFAYPTEILPFHARQKGMACVNFGNGALLIFNAFVNPIALEAIGWKYYLVWVVLLAIITVVVYLFFAETKGRPLEEIPDIFEGPAIVPKHARRLLQRRST
ncbi:hypothetical protein LTR10_018208 [Elasticomyces elasticus]|uniref:Major facilitator superfamily (MFS) profile domain-containing protein n=1 Tax=Exophiala sideris TaxID=1016849 RepID=A0ABR0J2L0_9EURO|nr:hypothetical protein LTR10_018208 [Elasticomyces elasticus]KAK5024910.1 hypothetical protein LTS07_008288 [Exophiala sideris]KAK5031500.1 hypothetical protein LTR13_007828 [Exophiala sideris]KAK5054949.1 hypothetical protein LTR69_008517 [Exophiala sideris]KAK5179829.1 hypothetical protein LTR44_007645 [Eurotiomycetes sp. CCFEE 6388]